MGFYFILSHLFHCFCCLNFKWFALSDPTTAILLKTAFRDSCYQSGQLLHQERGGWAERGPWRWRGGAYLICSGTPARRSSSRQWWRTQWEWQQRQAWRCWGSRTCRKVSEKIARSCSTAGLWMERQEFWNFPVISSLSEHEDEIVHGSEDMAPFAGDHSLLLSFQKVPFRSS